MKRSLSESFRFRPALETLEGRDLPSTAGLLTAVTVSTWTSQAEASATARTNNLQTDFATLQNNITNSGPTASVTIASLGKAASDYGAAEQTYNLLSHTITLLEGQIFAGAALGIYDQSDTALLAFSLNQLTTAQNAIKNDASMTATIALTPFANNTNYGGNINLAGVAGEGPIPPDQLA